MIEVMKMSGENNHQRAAAGVPRRQTRRRATCVKQTVSPSCGGDPVVELARRVEQRTNEPVGGGAWSAARCREYSDPIRSTNKPLSSRATQAFALS